MVDSTVAAWAGRRRGIALAAGLHALRVNARGASVGGSTFLPAVVDVEDVEGVDVAGDISVGRVCTFARLVFLTYPSLITLTSDR